MPARWRLRESWLWHALLCVACLALLAPSPPVPGLSGRGVGPPFPAGVRSELWRTDFRDGWSDSVFLGTSLVLTHGDQIEGRDATTGRVLWTFDASEVEGYAPPEDRLEATGDYVVAVAPHEGVDDEDDPRGDDLLAFHGRTGAILWNITSGHRGIDVPRPYLNYLGVGRGRVLIHLPGLGVVRALGAMDGRRRWEYAVPAGCTGVSGDADEWTVALLMTCGRRTRIEVLDPGSGRLMWEREVFPLGNPLVTVDGGVVGLESDAALTVYDAGGRPLFEHVGDMACACQLAATAAGLLIVRPSGVSDSYAAVTEVVNRLNGHVTRLTGAAGALEGVMAVGGRLYGVRPLAPDLLGTVVVMIDPVTGRQTPITGFPSFQEVVGLGEHIMIVNDVGREAGTTLIAYRTSPTSPADSGAAVRDGVARERWPDACALVPPAALPALFAGARYRFVARPAPPELALATPTRCDLIPVLPASAGRPVITLNVLWVSRTPDEAETVLQARRARLGNTKRVTDDSGNRMYVDRAMTDMVILRVGGTLIRMDGAGDQAVAVRLASRVASVLRGLT
nr:PQQ-binding-like beta-propeller repeat protein [Nonomuraea sp. FMUSA5-5]